jgi:hypothetical protein
LPGSERIDAPLGSSMNSLIYKNEKRASVIEVM